MADDILERQELLETASRKIISAMEENIYDQYSSEGLYMAFVAGWLPVPELWSDSQEFIYAKGWEARVSNGGIVLCNQDLTVTTDY